MKKILMYGTIIGIIISVIDYVFFPCFGIILVPIYPFFEILVLGKLPFLFTFLLYRLSMVLIITALTALLYGHVLFLQQRSKKILLLVLIDILIILSFFFSRSLQNKSDYCDLLPATSRYNCLQKKLMETYDPALCPKFDKVYSQNNCYSDIVDHTRNYELCDLIKLDRGSSSDKDLCYYWAAINSHDLNYCQKISGEYFRKKCLEKKAPYIINQE